MVYENKETTKPKLIIYENNSDNIDEIYKSIFNMGYTWSNKTTTIIDDDKTVQYLFLYEKDKILKFGKDIDNLNDYIEKTPIFLKKQILFYLVH